MPDPYEFGVVLNGPLPVFGGRPGDHLIVRGGHPRPITLMRDLPPDFAPIMNALRAGTAVPLNPARSTDDLVRALASIRLHQMAGERPVPAAPEPRKYGRLQLVKRGAP